MKFQDIVLQSLLHITGRVMVVDSVVLQLFRRKFQDIVLQSLLHVTGRVMLVDSVVLQLFRTVNAGKIPVYHPAAFLLAQHRAYRSKGRS
jgi:hypothetical protein